MKILKIDRDQRLVYGEVYAPEVMDAHGDFMSAETIAAMAHDFLMAGKTRCIDVNHDQMDRDAAVVESFIARKGDPDFITGAWVVGVKIFDEALWEQVKSGEINGFSIDGVGEKVSVSIEVDSCDSISGETYESNGHTHQFTVFLDGSGQFAGGITDTVMGHFHLINKGTVTEKANAHSHRFSYIEKL